jgi:RHS repeat-associated protein
LTVYPASNPSQIIDYEYDDYGRVLTKTENINGTDFISSFDYNEKGQLINETYPSNVKIENVYDNKGYLYKVMRVEGQNKNETKSELWRLISLDQFGSTLQYSLSDGKITTKKTFDDYKLPTSIKTQCYLSSIFYIQNLNYNWDDNKAILNYREDVKNYQKEEFSYDELDRLKQYDIEDKCSTPNKSKTITMNYNTDGSIDSKSDMGTYRYKENGTNALQTPIHAVKRLGDLGSSPPIQYSMPILHTIYNSFRKIKRIQEGLITADFSYGYDESRMKVVFKNNGNDNEIYTKYYLDNYERITTSGNTTKEITYITTRNGLVAAIVKQGTTERTLFVHKDYLGSVQALSEVGVNSVNIVAEFSYDPWGRARQFNDWTNLYASDASAPGFDILERSFTGQEHIIQFGIINMNARLYDSKMGSFLSPDNEVTNPENPQNYNRYSYALNNPLKYTDPSGNFPILAIMYAASLMYSATNVMVAIQNQNYQAAFLGVFSFAASAGIGSMVGGAANSILGTNLNSLESLLSNVGQGLISSFAQGMMMEGKYTGGAALQSVAFSTLGWGVDQLSRSESKNSINEWFEPTKENGVQPDQKIKYTHDPKGSEANSSHTYGDKDIYEIKYYNEDQIEKEISINMSKKLKSESDFDYLKRESPEHKQMDSKQRLDKNTVYVIDQIGYNYAEAGNYFWGASVAKMEGSIGWLGMNGGAQLYAIKNTIWIDQPWEVVAYNRAYFKYAPNISIPLPHTFR